MKRAVPLLSAALALGVGGLLPLSGCAGTATRQSTGELIDDGTVTAKVKAALLRDPVVSGLAVQVETFRGTVQLAGFVDSAEQRARAEEIARTIQGVSAVDNKLTVKTNVAPNP